jgi:hypothetical protein
VLGGLLVPCSCSMVLGHAERSWAWLSQRKPSLRELTCLDATELHACTRASFASAWISPFKREGGDGYEPR